jgi:uncharacterized protein (DUF433 family)
LRTKPSGHILYPVQGILVASAPLSATEVAALSGLDESRVRKEVEHGIFASPNFDARDLVYFLALARLGVDLGVEDRRRFHGLVVQALASRRPLRHLEFGPILEVHLDRVAEDAKAKLARFETWKRARVVADDRVLGGEPTFPKSRLGVRHLGGMLLRGARPEEVREDYPYLTEEDVEFAPVFARAYPRMGRPRGRQAAAR